MMLRVKQGMMRLLLAYGVLIGISATARASSELVQGQFIQSDPAGPSYQGPGVCRFITGPREDLGPGRFVITAGDHDDPDFSTVRLTGAFSATVTPAGRTFTLYPDKEAAERYVEHVLRKQLSDKWAIFHLESLAVTMTETQPDRLICSINLVGRLDGGTLRPRQVSFSFSHQGLYDPGFAAQTTALAPDQTLSAMSAAPDQCPTTDPKHLNASLAPLGLAPVPDQCGTAQCLIPFKGYKWWTSFQYYGSRGGFFPDGGYFYNGGLGTAFAPKNAFVDSAGLHLKVAKQDLGGGETTAGSEVALMFQSDGSEANLGYGDYLVTARVISASSWAMLDPNVAFGVFTFERVGTGATGPATNPHREIDLAELSRWGWDHTGACPFTGSSLPLCEGNAQFTLQPWENKAANLHRYTVKQGVSTVTLVMKWHGKNEPVEFEQYDGAFGFGDLPAKPDNIWTTSADQNEFVPATRCERFHLNLWLGNYLTRQEPHPGPKTLPQEVLITNFEFRKSP